MDNTIHRFKNARIAMFVGDHPPVHVHLLGPGFKVSIEVATLITKGRADAKMVAEAKAWIVKIANTSCGYGQNEGRNDERTEH